MQTASVKQGEVFKNLTVIADREIRQINGRSIGFYLCKCVCGKTNSVRGFDLKNGKPSLVAANNHTSNTL